MALLEVSNVSKQYGKGFAVKRVSLSAERGDIVCLLGPSGCGKTTMLRLIAGLESPDDGTITFDGRVLNRAPARDRGFGLMFQDLALFPHMDVWGNVSFGLRMQRRDRDQVWARVNALLRLVGLDDFQKRKVHELSGGERQRVAIATALAQQTPVLLLDEPTANLDLAYQPAIMTLMRELASGGKTVVVAVHDLTLAGQFCDEVALMVEGAMHAVGRPEEALTEVNVRKAYGAEVTVLAHPATGKPIVVNP